MTSLAPDAPMIEALFADAQGQFRFARWSRPVVPVVFGAADESLPVLKGAIETVVRAAGHEVAAADPDMAANLLIFFLRDWNELAEVESLQSLLPDLDTLLPRLQSGDADQYRSFRFDRHGAIKAGFVFLRMQGPLGQMPAADLAVEQTVKSLLLWSPEAFAQRSALALIDDAKGAVLRPDIAALLRAAYDPVLPSASRDPVLALRLAARAAQVFDGA